MFFALPALRLEAQNRKLIIFSIDGLPAEYFHNNDSVKSIAPNLYTFFKKAKSNYQLQSVLPSLTYPAHTSMVTGKDPAVHGISLNSFPEYETGKLQSWMWYREDVRVRTLYDHFRKHKKKTASVYWPVTAGAVIDYNIPQIWISGNVIDGKLLNIVSGRFYHWLEKKTGITLNESSSDTDRVQAAIATWKYKKPDLLLVYTMDLDTVQHKSGKNSPEAMATLAVIDTLFGKFLADTGIYKKGNRTALAVVSDHGFHASNRICKPNLVLKEEGLYTEDLHNFYFSSAGGVAVLLNGSGNSLLPEAAVLESIGKKLEVCGVTVDFSGAMLKRAKQEMNPAILGILVSNGDVVFRNQTEGSLVENPAEPVYTHGFLPESAAMRTVGSFYPPVAGKLEDVKDIFYLSCKWMKFSCN